MNKAFKVLNFKKLPKSEIEFFLEFVFKYDTLTLK